MDIQQIGKVVDCKHCGGTGKCNCMSCVENNGFDSDDYKISVACFPCKGIGSVWVGPASISIINNPIPCIQ